MKLADRKRVLGCSIIYTKNYEKKQIFKVFTSNINRIKEIKENVRDYPADWIYTLNYFGAKRSARVEYEILYMYVCNKYNVSVLADAFGGSGTISLLGAKSGLFSEIFLNELSYLTINYHYVMKNENLKAYNQNIDISNYQREQEYQYFEDFIYHLTKINEFKFDDIKRSYKMFTFQQKVITKKHKNGKMESIQIWVPKRIQVRKANVKHAVLFYLMQYYACRGDGEYDPKLIKNDLGIEVYKEPRDFIDELRKTHKLYKNIVLSQKYYKKFIKDFLDNKSALIVLDPPYLAKTRIHKDSYVFEMSNRQHRYLLQELTKENYKAKIIVCGFNSYMYNHYFDLFNKKQNEVVWHNVKMKKRHNSCIDLKKRRYEYIWVNFDVTDLIKNNPDYFEEFDISEEAKRLATKRKRKHIKKATFKKRDL